MSLLAILAALASAAFNALASALHHRAGADRSGFAVVLQPLWLLGIAAAAAGFTLHTLALQVGQLAVVQPALVSGLIFALPIAALLEKRQVRAAHLGWSLMVVVGLTLFLGLARATVGSPTARPGVLAAAAGLVTALAVASYLVGVRWRRHRPVLWAFAGGGGYGVVAALMKEGVGLLDVGVHQLITSWAFYALLVVGPASVAVNQAAFNAGPLVSSLPMLTIANPVVAIALGAVAFGERIASGPLPLAGQALGFVIMAVGVVALAAPARQPREEEV